MYDHSGHLRNVSPETSNLGAIEAIAGHGKARSRGVQYQPDGPLRLGAT
jgi:hypothetical protein